MKKERNQSIVVGREIVIWGLMVLGVGMLVSFSYADSSNGVYHGVLDVVWGAIADDLTGGSPSYDSTNFLRDLNVASDAQEDKWTGVDADTLDGLDSSEIFDLIGGGGSSNRYYAKECTWVSYVDVDFGSDTFDNWAYIIGDFWPQNQDPPCTDNMGVFTEPLPSCDGLDPSVGVFCSIRGISVVNPIILSFPLPASGIFSSYGGPDSPQYFETGSDYYPGRNYATAGVCQRVCEAA